MANLVQAQLLLGNQIIIFNTYSQQPTTGQINCVYYYMDTKISYTWNGTAYVLLSNSVTDMSFFATISIFPTIGVVNQLYVLTGFDYIYTFDIPSSQYIFLCQATSLQQQIIDNIEVIYTYPAIPPSGLQINATYIIGFDYMPYVENGIGNIKIYMSTQNIMNYFSATSQLLWTEILGNAVIIPDVISVTESPNGGNMSTDKYDPNCTGIVNLAQSANTLQGHSLAYFTVPIAANTAAILALSGGTGTEEDSAQVTTNTNNIATNTENIATNTTNIATNTENIGTNAINTANNTTAIAANTLAISNIGAGGSSAQTTTNTNNIATNTTNIATNATNIANKIQTMVYTSIASNVTNVVHGFVFNPLHDLLECVDNMYNDLLVGNGVSYTLNANNISIDLVGWSLSIGDSMNIKITRGVK